MAKEAEVATLKRKLEEHQSEAGKEKLKSLQDKVALAAAQETNERLASAEAKSQAAEERVVELEVEVKMAERQRDEAIGQLKTNRVQFREKDQTIQTLTGRCDAAEKEVKTLREVTDSLETAMQLDKNQRDALHAEKEALETRVDSLEAETRRLQQQLKSAEEKLAQVTAERVQLLATTGRVILELQASVEVEKASERQRAERLAKQVAALSVPEISFKELKRVGAENLGKGACKTAWLCEWRGQKVVQMELNDVTLAFC